MKKPRDLISTLIVFLMLVTGCNSGISQPDVNTLSDASSSGNGHEGGVSGPEGGNVNFAEGFIRPDDEGLMQGFAGKVGGFGGDITKSQAENRAALRYRPVILVHGQGAKANGQHWGFKQLYSQLIQKGYNAAELWGISYLGTIGYNVEWQDAHIDTPFQYSNNVNELREFVKNVCAYLNVEKVDIIAHSLGATLTRCAIHGYRKTGFFGGDFNGEQIADKVGTVVLICGANYGFEGGGGEWDCPRNAIYDKVNKPVAGITYVAARSVGDFVDQASPPNCSQQPPGTSEASTSYFLPAVKNITLDYTSTFAIGNKKTYERHQYATRDPEALEQYVEFLKNPLNNAPVATMAPASGEYLEGQLVTISATNNPTTIYYKIDSGTFETYSTALSLSSVRTYEIEAYAVNEAGEGNHVTNTYTIVAPPSEVPVVTISPAGQDFEDSIEVTITANNAATSIDYKLDSGNWTVYTEAINLTNTSTVYARATNVVGTSAVKSEIFTKTAPPYEDKATDTLTGHQIAGRVVFTYPDMYAPPNGYIYLFEKHGTDVFTMWKVNGAWTDISPV